MKRKSPKYRHLIEFLVIILAIFVINIIGSFKFFRIDLTEDKMHSLNPKTKEYLENEVNNVINIVIYLHGDDLPPVVQKFKQSLKDKLDEFKAYAGNNIKYTFVDINEDPTLTAKYKETFKANFVSGNTIQLSDQGSVKFDEFFPIAEVRYESQVKFIDFMGDKIAVTPYYIDQKINFIEYDFLSAFLNVSDKPKPRVSFLKGHGELEKIETSSVFLELKNFYNMDEVQITTQKDSLTPPKENLKALDKTDVLIVAKPRLPFTDKELFIIDQFIMKGGKVIWSLDMINDHEDSLGVKGKFVTNTEPNNQFDNLEKMLYKYGAGIKKNFVTNKICAPQLRYDQRTESYWNKYYYNNHEQTLEISPIIEQWYPFPCVTMEGSELTKNIGRVKLKYPSTININQGAKVTKTVLLESDYEYKEWPAITRIRYDERNVWDDLNNIEKAGQFYAPVLDPSKPLKKEPLAVMLEGEFETNFSKEIMSPVFVAGMEEANFKLSEKSKPSHMMIIGDGDFLRSEIIYSQKGWIPINLGLDYLISNEMIYGNTTFLHNCIDKMTGSDYLIPLRSRVNLPRFLNSDELYYNRGKWQLINLVIPGIFVLILGLGQWIIRRKSYLGK